MVELAFKVSIVLVATLALASLLRAASAAWRHRVLAVGVAAALAVPALTMLLPRWAVMEPVAIEAAPPDLVRAMGLDAERGGRTTSASPAPEPVSPERVSSLAPAPLAAALWALGVAVMLLRLLGAHRRARRLAREGEAVCELGAPAAPGEGPIAGAAREAYLELGARRAVRVVLAPVGGPLTLGVLRPQILVPRDAARWGRARLRMTLLHELAHVERADVAWLLVAQIARALFVWNPLAWIALGRLRREAEHAADDRVLSVGARASDYATVLLRAATLERPPSTAMGMARRSDLERRIEGVLGPARRTAPSAAARTGALGVALAVAGAAACAGPPSSGPVRVADAATDLREDAPRVAREELAALVERASPRTARLVVLDCASGSVLAVAAHGGEPHREAVRPIEIGSTLKPLTVAAALEAGLDPTRAHFLEGGAWELGDQTLRDWRDLGSLDATGVLARSSNIGAGKIYLGLGAARTRESLERLGIGRGPTLGVEGAEARALPPIEAWDGAAGVMLATGIATYATPLEIASAYAALANDGVRVEPSLDGTGERARVLSSTTARQLREMLVHAVEDEGATGRNARVAGLRVGGKTGTVDLPDGGRRALFVGVVPADAPRYVVYVDADVEAPRDAFTGGSIAAPAFARVAARLAR